MLEQVFQIHMPGRGLSEFEAGGPCRYYKWALTNNLMWWSDTPDTPTFINLNQIRGRV